MLSNVVLCSDMDSEPVKRDLVIGDTSYSLLDV